MNIDECVYTMDHELMQVLHILHNALKEADMPIKGAPQGIFVVCEALEKPDHPHGLLEGKQILLVDDDDDILRLIASGLYAGGAAVATADAGLAAIRYVRATNNQLDLVVIDVNMPDMDGFETCRHLRTRGYTSPVIIFTACMSPEGAVEAFNAGAQVYMSKEVGPYHLLAAAVHLCEGTHG